MQNLAFFILLLGVLVTVHELGHFLVAKACGVKVIRFSIGFGPKLFGFTKGETEYQVALLPLGGYVKMAGDSPHEELSPEEAKRGFLNAAPWKRALIVFAGPFFNLVFPILVYFFVFMGAHETTSTRVGYVDPAMPAATAGIRPGDRILAVEEERVQTFAELIDAFEGRFERPVAITLERDGKELVTRVTPIKRVDATPISKVERGVIGIQAFNRPPVVGVPPGSPAAEAGLKSFDRILTLDGQEVRDEASLYEQLSKAGEGPLKLTVHRSDILEVGGVQGRVPSIMELTVPKQSGEGLAALGGAEPVDLYVATITPGSAAEKAGLRPGDRLLSFQGEPLRSFHLMAVELSKLGEKPFELTWRTGDGQERTLQLAQTSIVQKDEFSNESSSLVLGVSPWYAPADSTGENQVTVHLGPWEALREAATIVPKIIGQMVMVIGGLVSGGVSPKTLGGPIMMYQLAARSAEQGADQFLHLMAVISINLGVMNLLPIPILDGFHLLAAFWEGIRRRPIPVRVREVANMVGLALLILLMGMAFFNDITR